MHIKPITFASTTLAVAALLLLIACGEGSDTPGPRFGGNAPGSVITTISDPATCAAPAGPFSRVIVTVSRVRAHTNANALDNDAGFVDLTPANMAPVQVDLLGTPTAQCFLAQLGTNAQVPAGTYQQVRIILLANDQAVANNLCGVGNGVNCVVLTSDGSTRQLALSSEATTGIKIPSGQISSGSFVVRASQPVNLNLNFNACQSIVASALNQFRLKPAVRAEAISTTANTITGRIVDSVTNAPIAGGKVIVALEQRDSSNFERIIMETTPDGAGNFIFCPVAPGTYEVVATAVNGANVGYAATVTTGVQPGASLGNIPIIPQPGSGSVTTPATVSGSLSTTGIAGATPADVVLAAMQPLTIGTSNVLVTVPLAAQGGSSITVTTQASGCAVASTACANYSLQVPAANPNVGAFSVTGTTYTQNTVAPVNYAVDGQAFVVSSPATPNCTPSVLQVSTVSGGAALTVTGGATVTAAPMAFGGCQ